MLVYNKSYQLQWGTIIILLLFRHYDSAKQHLELGWYNFYSTVENNKKKKEKKSNIFHCSYICHDHWPITIRWYNGPSGQRHCTTCLHQQWCNNFVMHRPTLLRSCVGPGAGGGALCKGTPQYSPFSHWRRPDGSNASKRSDSILKILHVWFSDDGRPRTVEKWQKKNRPTVLRRTTGEKWAKTMVISERRARRAPN